MQDIKNEDQLDLDNRIRYMSIMIRAIAPLVVLVGLVGVPFFSVDQAYWRVPTVIPAALFLVVSLLSFTLLRYGQYKQAISIYAYGFILAPLAAAVSSGGSSPGLLGLMVGGVIVATVFFESRQAVYVSAFVAILSAVAFVLLYAGSTNLDKFIILGVIITLIALVLIFKAINDEIEQQRRAKLKEINAQLVRQNKELVKINEELDKFIYSVSHDIRAPLTSIIGLVNLYRSEPEDEVRESYIDHIDTSTKKLEKYIYDIVDFVKNAKTEVSNEKINIEAFLQDIYSQLQYINPMGNISFEVYCDGVEQIITDKERLGIILRNILSNSIKYSKQEAGAYIKCFIEKNDTHSIFRIQDNGIGIEESQLDKVFKMFHRSSERSKGSGLGLYIARETAEMLGGKLEISSEFGKSTELILEIPQ